VTEGIVAGFRGAGPVGTVSKGFLAIAGILIVMITLYVAVLDNSPILPGNWTPYEPSMLFYIVLVFAAILVIYTRPSVLTQAGTTGSQFVLRLAAFSGATWLILSLLFLFSGPGVTPTGTTRLILIVQYSVYTACAEELFFRTALSSALNLRLWGSTVIFAGMHVPVYFLAAGGVVGISLVSSVIQAAIMGTVLWWVYAKPKEGGILGMGLGATIGIHFTYDAVIAGVVLALPLSLAGLGLVPV
jgi:Type II CAAX prenyl endopeptidase Rce1-like